MLVFRNAAGEKACREQGKGMLYMQPAQIVLNGHTKAIS